VCRIFLVFNYDNDRAQSSLMAVRAHPDFGLRTTDLGLLRTVRVLCKAIHTHTPMKKTLEKKAAWQRSLGKQVEEKNWHWAGIYMYVSKSCSTPRKTKKKSKSGKKNQRRRAKKNHCPIAWF